MKRKFMPFSVPSVGKEEAKAVASVIRSGWLTTGGKAREFEEEFKKLVGAKHAVALSSCTAALHLALEAIGIREGDRVMTSPMTFASTAEVIRYFGAEPVFVDVEPDTLNIDHEKLKRKTEELSARGLAPKAVMPVHYAGHPAEMDGIMQVAEKYGMRVIEDAAHAFPAKYRGRAVGAIGDITCFSFYATKNITTGEGGMAVTGNPQWAERMRVMSLHGISKDAWRRYSSEGTWRYEITAPGYKYNMTDISAAIGLEQLKKLDSLQIRRREIADSYDRAFAGLPFFKKTAVRRHVEHALHLYVIALNPEALRIGRDGFVEELKKLGIGTSVHFIPLHIHPYYKEAFGYGPEDFPEAFGAYKRIISLPLYPSMKEEDVWRVIKAVTETAGRFSA